MEGWMHAPMAGWLGHCMHGRTDTLAGDALMLVCVHADSAHEPVETQRSQFNGRSQWSVAGALSACHGFPQALTLALTTTSSLCIPIQEPT